MNYLDKKFHFLKPVANKNLKRIGINKDGGYVVDSKLFNESECLLSFGLGNDWSFELEYLKRNNCAKIHMYDHTINYLIFLKPLLKYFKRFILFRIKFSDLYSRISKFVSYFSFVGNRRVKFFKKKISKENKTNATSATNALNKLTNFKKILLKVDIEGSEYEIIDEILENHKKIKMILIEFHQIDLKEEIFIDCIKNLLNKFYIVHLHGNNHCSKSETGIPIALEITLINKEYYPQQISYERNFPRDNLDFPNNPHKEDISFSFE